MKKCWGGYDAYGSTETGNFAFEMYDSPNGKVVCQDSYVVNVVNEQGEICKCGRGRIYVTPLHIKGFPLINYDLGDVVEIYTADDGRQYIKLVCGRNNEYILNPDGSKCLLGDVLDVIAGVQSIMQCKVAQEDLEHLSITLVKLKRDLRHKSEIEADVLHGLNNLFCRYPKKIRFYWSDLLLVEDNAKLRVFTSKIN